MQSLEPDQGFTLIENRTDSYREWQVGLNALHVSLVHKAMLGFSIRIRTKRQPPSERHARNSSGTTINWGQERTWMVVVEGGLPKSYTLFLGHTTGNAVCWLGCSCIAGYL